ncbi:MAG TPA: M56 family metallopeptidase [Bryobacterales bacterium]|nr:M56 family metallopeptidase [Bryobacterales bacterium]
MTGELLNLLDYCCQVVILVAAGGLLPLLFRVRDPRVRLGYWRAVLGACLLLPALQPWYAPHVVAAPGFTLAVSSAAAGHAVQGYSWATIAWALLAAGAVTRLSLLGLGLLRLRRLRAGARPMPEAGQGSPEVAVCLSPDVDGPVTFGWRRPVVLLPESFVESDADTRRAVLTHELIHVERRDWVWTVGEELVRGLLWFHPAIGWLIGRIQLAREQVVDREVVARTGSREAYLRALVEITRARLRPAIVAAPAFMRGRHFKARIKTLLEDISMTKWRLAVSTVGMAALLGAAAVVSISYFPLRAAPQNDAEVHRVGNGTSAPRLIKKVEPSYTEEAREAKLEGTVVLASEIWPDGKAHEIEVIRGLGKGLDEQAVIAIEQWDFEPGMKDGEAVKVSARINVDFRL